MSSTTSTTTGTTTTTTVILTGLDGLLTAIYKALNGIAATYRLNAPQCAAMPFIVIEPLGGEVNYCFGTSEIARARIQITAYGKWTGNSAAMIAIFDAITAALDRKPLTDDGIIAFRATLPIVQVIDGEVIRGVQDWLCERQE